MTTSMGRSVEGGCRAMLASLKLSDGAHHAPGHFLQQSLRLWLTPITEPQFDWKQEWDSLVIEADV